MPAKSQKKHNKAAATVAATKEPEAEPVKAVAVVEAAPADKKKKGKGKLTSSEVAPAPAEVEKRVQEPTSQEQPKPEHTQHGEKAAAANKGTRGEKTGKKRERDGRTKAVSEEDHQAGSKRSDPRVANPVLTYTTQQWAEKAAAALMAVASREDADRSLLFADERLVKLQVVHTSGHLLPRGKMDVYVQLPYPLHDQRTSSGVLLVRDENIQKQMEALNIPGVTKVINYKTYHATYNTPELVQSLVNAHEVFMADRIVLPLLQLGPLVLRNRVLFHVDCLSRPAQDVAVAFRSTGVKLESRWLFANVVIGRSDASPQQLADNAMAVLESLCAHIPLGWKAIRSVSMKIDGTDVPPLPVYTRPEEVEATMREESAALEKEVAARLEEDKKVELEFRHKRNEQRRKDRDDLRLVYSRWEAFRKAPHLFGESPPEEKPEPERQGEAAEAVDAAASTTDATNNANEVAAGADTGAVEEPAKKRKKGPKKVA